MFIFSSISLELAHYCMMFPLFCFMLRAWPSLNLSPFVLMRKILLIRHVIAATLMHVCVCVQYARRFTTSANVCTAPTYVFFPSPFPTHWAVRLMLGSVIFSAIRRCSVMPPPPGWQSWLFSSGESKWSSFSQTINPRGSLGFRLPLTSELWLFICFIYIAAFMSFHQQVCLYRKLMASQSCNSKVRKVCVCPSVCVCASSRIFNVGISTQRFASVCVYMCVILCVLSSILSVKINIFKMLSVVLDELSCS